MSGSKREAIDVVIIGAGASGLTAGAFLKMSGVSCVVLEAQSRQYVEQRQRAGNLEARAVHMFDRWGLGERVVAGTPYNKPTEYVIDGVSQRLDEILPEDSGLPQARMCPQQVLIRNLLKVHEEEGVDLRFDSKVVAIGGLETDEPVVSYITADGVEHRIDCKLVGGCDGFHGTSRKSIPEGVLTRYSYDYDGYAWLNILLESPPRIRLALGKAGYAAQFPRGPQYSRYYLQCKATDTRADWPDERIWSELRTCFGEPAMPHYPVIDCDVFALRSVVFEPMRYRNLFLIGDAAHIISPVGGKGMNLALFDAETFVLAGRDFVQKGDASGLDAYSETCLERTWNYQDFSIWCTQMLHDASALSNVDPFRAKLAYARIKRLFRSKRQVQAYAELLAGFA